MWNPVVHMSMILGVLCGVSSPGKSTTNKRDVTCLKCIEKLKKEPTIVYNGFVKVSQFDYKGKTYDKVHLKNAVACLVTNRDAGVLLVKQYRPALGKFTWEIPAGVMDKDLCPRKTMLEELSEECNIHPNIDDICGYHTFNHSVGTGDSYTEIFQLDYKLEITCHRNVIKDDVVTETKWFQVIDLSRMLSTGEICDAKTIISLYKMMGSF